MGSWINSGVNLISPWPFSAQTKAQVALHSGRVQGRAGRDQRRRVLQYAPLLWAIYMSYTVLYSHSDRSYMICKQKHV